MAPPATSIAELRDKLIGIEDGPGSASHFILQTALVTAELNQANVRITVVPPAEQLSALQNGKVDAVLTSKQIAMTAVFQGAGALLFSDWSPGVSSSILVFSDRFIAERPAVAIGLLAALIAASRDIQAVHFAADNAATFQRLAGTTADQLKINSPHIREDDRQHRFDRDRILGGMARLGLLGISVPQEYGGAGMDYVCLGIASEELEYVDTSLRVIMSVHAGLNCLTLLAWGTEDQKQRYLVPQAQGDKIAGYGLTEPAPAATRAAIQTTAVKKGDRYVLNGEKIVDLAGRRRRQLPRLRLDRSREEAAARSRPASARSSSSAAFKGFSSGPMKEKWGILAGNTGWFKMDEVEVPEENLVGRPGEGFKIAMFALDQGRFTVAAGATGLIRACRDASVRTRKSASTFGVEIGQHQLVKEMIAQMESDYQASRLLWLRSGWLKNEGGATRARPGSRNGSPPSRRSAPRATPCRFTAPTATPTNIRSAASIATARAR